MGAAGRYRLEGLRADAAVRTALQVMCAQALEQVIVELADQRFATRADVWERLRGDRLVENGRQIDIQTVLEQDAQGTDGGATQAEGITRTTGTLPDRKDASQQIELVGERDSIPDARARERIPGGARQIVIGDGLGHHGG